MQTNKVLLFIEGLLLIILGFLVISQPVGSILILSSFLTWFLIFLGIAEIIRAFTQSDSNHRMLSIAEGVIILILGLLFLFKSPIFSAVILVYLTIMWFLISSIAQISLASKVYNNGLKYLMYLLNIFVIIVCIYSLFDPGIAAGIFIFTLSFNFFMLGLSRILLMFSYRPEPSND